MKNSSNQSSKSRNEHCHAENCETPNRITAKVIKMLNYKNVLINGIEVSCEIYEKKIELDSLKEEFG
jgi:hypothetical protein